MALAKRSLGRTGLHVTQLGYGSMGIRGPRTWGVRVVEEADAERILHQVLDLGINFIDTSPDYGLSEERIGRYLAARRDEFFLATKCGCVYVQKDDHLQLDHVWTKEVIRGNLDTSRRRLQTDRIDLLQFHGGKAETLQRDGLIDWLVEMRDQGTIRFLGVSTSLPEATAFLELGVFDTIQLPYSCLAPQHDTIMTQAGLAGVGVIVRGGIAQGGPDAVIQRPALNDVWNGAQLDALLPEGMTRAELILRYTLSHPHADTVIVGTCNPHHLQENVRAAEVGPLPNGCLHAVRAALERPE